MIDSPRLANMMARVALRRNGDSAIQIKLGFFIRKYSVVKIGNLLRLVHGLFLKKNARSFYNPLHHSVKTRELSSRPWGVKADCKIMWG
jgi:hypothetical protein